MSFTLVSSVVFTSSPLVSSVVFTSSPPVSSVFFSGRIRRGSIFLGAVSQHELNAFFEKNCYSHLHGKNLNSENPGSEREIEVSIFSTRFECIFTSSPLV